MITPERLAMQNPKPRIRIAQHRRHKHIWMVSGYGLRGHGYDVSQAFESWAGKYLRHRNMPPLPYVD